MWDIYLEPIEAETLKSQLPIAAELETIITVQSLTGFGRWDWTELGTPENTRDRFLYFSERIIPLVWSEDQRISSEHTCRISLDFITSVELIVQECSIGVTFFSGTQNEIKDSFSHLSLCSYGEGKELYSLKGDLSSQFLQMSHF